MASSRPAAADGVAGPGFFREHLSDREQNLPARVTMEDESGGGKSTIAFF
jgi:hypothetical protein